MLEKFSVLLSVYINEKPEYLERCLRSIYEQDLQADEVVLVEDGPLTEKLYEVIDFYRGLLPLKTLRLNVNGGLANALNHGLELCNYDLVARMDTDDISLKNRFFEQVNFMSLNKNISASSSYIEECNDDMTEVICVKKLPTHHSTILSFAKFRSPLSHPAVIFRKSAVESVGGYPNIYPEDYPLWILMLNKGFQFANLPLVLVQMRAGDAMISRRGKKFLPGYVACYKLLYSLKMISFYRLQFNIFFQTILRNLPSPLIKLIYSFAR